MMDRGNLRGWIVSGTLALGATFAVASTGVASERLKACNEPAYAQAYQIVLNSFEAGVLKYGDTSRRLEIIIDRPFWSSMSEAERMGLARVVHCAIAGPGKALTAFTFVDDGGRVLWEYRRG